MESTNKESNTKNQETFPITHPSPEPLLPLSTDTLRTIYASHGLSTPPTTLDFIESEKRFQKIIETIHDTTVALTKVLIEMNGRIEKLEEAGKVYKESFEEAMKIIGKDSEVGRGIGKTFEDLGLGDEDVGNQLQDSHSKAHLMEMKLKEPGSERRVLQERDSLDDEGKTGDAVSISENSPDED